MTGPEQVLVNVADLRVLEGVCDELETRSGMPIHPALNRLVADIPEPEWEPTDDMRAKYRRVYGMPDTPEDNAYVDEYLKAMHREGLIP